MIKHSELILNDDGSIFHLHLKPENIGDHIILVGDPARVDTISTYFDKIEFTIQKKLKTSSPINYHVLFLSVCIQPGSSLQIRSVPMARHMSKHLLIILTLLSPPASFHEEEPKRSKPPANEIHEPDLDPEVVVARA